MVAVFDCHYFPGFGEGQPADHEVVEPGLEIFQRPAQHGRGRGIAPYAIQDAFLQGRVVGVLLLLRPPGSVLGRTEEEFVAGPLQGIGVQGGRGRTAGLFKEIPGVEDAGSGQIEAVAVIEQPPQAVLRFLGENNAPGRGQHITPAGGHVGTVLHRVKEKTLDGAHPADIDQRHGGLRKKALSLQVALQGQIAVRGLPLHLALEFEERRQRDLLLDGGTVVQDTRLWNPDTNRTETMRGKEEAHDYRYFPDPDLVPVQLSEELIAQMQGSLPELPDARKNRLMRDYDLGDYDADLLCASRELADFFESANALCQQPKRLANFIGTELLREVAADEMAACPVRPDDLGKLMRMVESGAISGKIAKGVFADMLQGGGDPEAIVRQKGLSQMSDEGELAAMAQEIVAANPEQAQQFREGKDKVLGFFVGQLMKKICGKVNPQLANELLRKTLK